MKLTGTNFTVFIFIGILFLLWMGFFLDVNAATVSISPRTVNPYGITINTKYGQVTPSNSQSFGSFTVYANGTVFFDNSALSTLVASYNFQSYGNGTLKLKWAAPKTPTITLVSGASPAYPNFGGVELDYSSSSTGAFILDWSPTVSNAFQNISYFLVIALSLLPPIALFGLFAVKGRSTLAGGGHKRYKDKQTGADTILETQKQPEYFSRVMKVAVVLALVAAIAFAFSLFTK